ncbi:hypothetical protein AHF37_01619 [Paragonimus kellicotti]|nr:hypothetical protein AHF37_01619 [Paragonimus kellicotti]
MLDYQNKMNEQKYFLMVSRDQQKHLIRAIVKLDTLIHDLSAFYTLVQNQQGLREELVTTVGLLSLLLLAIQFQLTNIQHVLEVKQLVARTVPLITSARELIGASTASSVEPRALTETLFETRMEYVLPFCVQNRLINNEFSLNL